MDRKLITAALATTAAALFAASTAVTTASADEDVKIKCYGANACKGHSECKTSMNGCKGKNACKGKGFEQMSEKACIDKVGRA